MTMLLGEFDFLDTIVADPNSTIWTKLVFALFLLRMSIVIMNLVIGLAISDVSSLRLVHRDPYRIVQLGRDTNPQIS